MSRRPQARPLHPARPLPDVTVGPTASNADVWRCVLKALAVLGGLGLLVLVAGGSEWLR